MANRNIPLVSELSGRSKLSTFFRQRERSAKSNGEVGEKSSTKVWEEPNGRKCDVAINDERVYLQDRTRYYIEEARRAIGYALLDKSMKNRNGYIEWMDNVVYLLTEAAKCRDNAHKEPWHLTLY